MLLLTYLLFDEWWNKNKSLKGKTKIQSLYIIFSIDKVFVENDTSSDGVPEMKKMWFNFVWLNHCIIRVYLKVRIFLPLSMFPFLPLLLNLFLYLPYSFSSLLILFISLDMEMCRWYSKVNWSANYQFF